MKLVLLRHADAGDAGEFKTKFKRPDRDRPLSKRGLRDAKLLARYFKKHFAAFDTIYCSQFKRAIQTARPFARHYKMSAYWERSELSPQAHPKKIVDILLSKSSSGRHLLVGHEPHLSQLLSYLLTGRLETGFDLKKCGWAEVEINMINIRSKIKSEIKSETKLKDKFKNQPKKFKAQLKKLLPPSLVRTHA